MNSDINPQLPYYLLLYVLTIILRFIRAYRNRPSADDASPEKKGEYYASFAFFSFELVNVSAGVFILLSEHASRYVGTVMILYVILVILSFFFEDERVGRTVKVTGHLIVSVIVFSVTLYAFFAVEGLKPAEKEIAAVAAPPPTPAITRWQVAIPYVDTSLNRNFNVKSNPLLSFYSVSVSAGSRIEAISLAKHEFYSEKGPSPFVEKSEKTPISMIVLEDSVVVEPVVPTGG